MEDSLIRLIKDGKVRGKINGPLRQFESSKVDGREEAFASAIASAEEFLENANLFILRSAMKRHNLIRAPPPEPEISLPSPVEPALQSATRGGHDVAATRSAEPNLREEEANTQTDMSQDSAR